MDDVNLFAEHSNGSIVLMTAHRSETGKVRAVAYLNTGFSLDDRSDDVFARIEVNKFKKFTKNIDGHFDYYVTPQNVESVAEIIDSLPGVSPGPFSTYFSINDNQVTAYA